MIELEFLQHTVMSYMRESLLLWKNSDIMGSILELDNT